MKRILYITIGLLSGLLMAGMLLPLLAHGQAGQLDPTFGTGGITQIQIGTVEFSTLDYARDVAVLPNDNILVMGDSYNDQTFNEEGAFARLLPDGVIDPSFGNNGIVLFTAGSAEVYPSGLKAMPNGKFVIAGMARTANKRDFLVAWFNADGSPDLTFNTTGHRLTSIGPLSDWARGVDVQADGKTVISGSVTLTPDLQVSNLGLVRYNTDGTLDNTFGTNGIVNQQVGPQQAGGTKCRIQPDGKIMVFGFAHNGTMYCFMAARFNANGTLDNTFGTGGIALHAIGSGASIGRDGFILPNGKILMAGQSNNGSQNAVTVIRMNADGSLDGTFGTGGVTTKVVGTNDQPYALTVQPDGGIVVTGETTQNGTDIFVARFAQDGAVDLNFGTDGATLTEGIGLGTEAARGIALQSTGNIIVAGYHSSGSFDFIMNVLRYVGSSCSPIDVDITVDGGQLTGPAGFSDYTWVDCDTQQPVGSSQSFLPSASGNYALTVMDAQGCIGVSDCEAVVITGAGTIGGQGVSVYPNPANDLLRISGLSGPLSVEVMDMAGRVVTSSLIGGERGDALNLESLAPGTYGLRLVGMGAVARFVKN